jgi:excisionase family DNA binding protein
VEELQMTDHIQDIRNLDRGKSGARSCNHRSENKEDREIVGETTTTKRCDSDVRADGEFLDVPQVAKYLNVSKSMVYKMVENQQIHAIRLGRLVRIRRCDLEQAIHDLSRQ